MKSTNKKLLQHLKWTLVAHSQAAVQEPVVKMLHTVGYRMCGEQYHFTKILGKTIDKKAGALKGCLLHLAYPWGQSSCSEGGTDGGCNKLARTFLAKRCCSWLSKALEGTLPPSMFHPTCYLDSKNKITINKTFSPPFNSPWQILQRYTQSLQRIHLKSQERMSTDLPL